MGKGLAGFCNCRTPPKFCGKEKLSFKGDPALPARLRGRPFNGPRTRPSQGDCLKLCLPRSRASHHAVKQGQQEPSGVRVWKSRPLQWDSICTRTLVGVVTGGATAGVRQVCRAQAKSRGPAGTGRETRVATGAQGGDVRRQLLQAPWGRRVGGCAGACVPAVVGAVGLDAAALGALVHHLPGLQL